MKFCPLTINDVIMIEPEVHADARGFFMETYRKQRFAEHGIIRDFVQINHSQSVHGALRGLHYQVDKPQAKLVRVIRGEVYDVAADIRFGSPTYGKWVGVTLSAQNKKELYMPVGFAHGFCVLSEEVELVYACTDYYYPQGQRGIIWNDPDLNITWPVNTPLLSERDKHLAKFSEIERDFIYSALKGSRKA